MSGKESVEAARRLAKAHGVELLGWNDKPGKEFVSLEGDGEKLEALKKEMVRDGWHAWPVDEAQEGRFMDFGMRPPPANAPKNIGGITADADSREPVLTGANFHYRGPGRLFLNNWIFSSLVPVSFVWLNRRWVPGAWDAPFKAAISAGILCATGLIMLLCHWIEIRGNDGALTIRRHFFGGTMVIPMPDVKKAIIYTETDMKGRKDKFLGINLKSGKAFDLFLPSKKQAELAAFIKSRANP